VDCAATAGQAAGGGHEGRRLAATRPTPLFGDRRDAGTALAERLRIWADAHPVVLGLPRGGVPVAYEVARALRAPLDVIVARKVGVPGEPELAIGAVAEGDVRVFDDAALRLLRVGAHTLDQEAARAAAEVRRRVGLYRERGRSIPLLRRTAIVVDDGLATGLSARAALRAVRAQDPRTLILAAPVGAYATVAALHAEADHVVCLEMPDGMLSIGECYEDFEQITDGEVIRLLIASRRHGDNAAA
jgi:putative phosphoribosyl transferase